MSRTTVRPALAALTLIVAVFAALVAPAGAAQAAAYRYWGYYQLAGTTWSFATKGADQVNPADGSVEGWRFAIGTEGSTRLPRVTPTFEDICGDTKTEAGKKRVGVVIDYGRKADTEGGTTEPPAPVAECASVATAATGAEVLAAVATVRAQGAMVCAVDNHPATGCGGEVKEVSAEAQAADTPVTLAAPKTDDAASGPAKSEDSGTSAGTYAGIAVVLVAAAALALVALRRRGQH